jgi:hypothetical protein
MALKDWLTLGISLAAFAVASYGMWDRRQESLRATRRQALDLIDDLSEIQVLQSEPRSDHEARTRSGWYRSLNGRREALIAMVEVLLGQLDDGLTSREYAVLASASVSNREVARAEKYWKLAVAAAANQPPALQCYSLRGYAAFHFNLNNDPDAGRALFERAIETVDDGTDTGHELAADTYLFWIPAERRSDPANPILNKLLDDLEGELAAIQHCGRRVDMEKRIYDSIGRFRTESSELPPPDSGQQPETDSIVHD